MNDGGAQQTQQGGSADATGGGRIAAIVAVAGRDAAPATVVVSRLTSAERTRRAARSAGLCMAIAVGSLAIPIVHFVMPWLMTIVAVIVWRRIRGQGADLLHVEASCPACAATVTVPQQPLVWPLEWNCDACRKRMVFTQEGGDEQQG